jgi:hypothetical protein
MWRWLKPMEMSLRISKTDSRVSLDCGLSSPNFTMWLSFGGWCWRFLLTLSAVLSSCVPKKRWAGLTHGGLSHLCKTNKSVGTDPKASQYETRGANRQLLEMRDMRTCPWPNFNREPFQIQQSPVLSTLVQKRAASSGRSLTIGMQRISVVVALIWSFIFKSARAFAYRAKVFASSSLLNLERSARSNQSTSTDSSTS